MAGEKRQQARLSLFEPQTRRSLGGVDLAHPPRFSPLSRSLCCCSCVRQATPSDSQTNPLSSPSEIAPIGGIRIRHSSQRSIAFSFARLQIFLAWALLRAAPATKAKQALRDSPSISNECNHGKCVTQNGSGRHAGGQKQVEMRQTISHSSFRIAVFCVPVCVQASLLRWTCRAARWA